MFKISAPNNISVGFNGSVDFSINITSLKDTNAIVEFKNFSDIQVKCINCSYTSKDGFDETKSIKFENGITKTVWCYAKPDNKCSVGKKCGKLIISSLGEPLFEEDFSIYVKNIKTTGRLHYLNSKLGINDEVIQPYVPVRQSDTSIKILGREWHLNNIGLPERIISYFNQNIKICDTPTDILSEEISFNADNENFVNINKEVYNFNTYSLQKFDNESENFVLNITAKFEFDGYAEYRMELIPKKDISLDNIFLKIPISEFCQKYFMGLSKQGGYFDKELNFKWNTNLNQDCFWVGNVNAGAKFLFKSDNYKRPLVNIYYSMSPLNLPESWNNNGKGGIKYDGYGFRAYTGNIGLKKGEKLHFDFDIITTPLKEIDLKKQMNMRIFHKYAKVENWVEQAASVGANIINVHHGNDLNPFINYPFVEKDALSDFITKAHEKNILVKLYYTIRELSVYANEFKAFKDLGHEIFMENSDIDQNLLWQGEMKEWIKENIGDDVIPAWRENLKGEKYHDSFDASIITNGQSRIANFYIAGLSELIDSCDIDGLYIDDAVIDRQTLRRAKRVMSKKKNLIDFHSWNHFDSCAGYTSSSLLYMELFPYIDKLWMGEDFDYTKPFDYWLIEISGIPFGLMSEMLQNGGNQWEGLNFGMTNRYGWIEEFSPTTVWNIFDKYLYNTELIGFWNDENPIILSNNNIKASLYTKQDADYIVVSNPTDSVQQTTISFKNARLVIPYIKDFQDKMDYHGQISIPPHKGYLIIAEK